MTENITIITFITRIYYINIRQITIFLVVKSNWFPRSM